VFDGKFVRRLGTEGGRTYSWEGHAGFIGACTEAIDSPSVDLGLLGERFTYYRMPVVTAEDDFLACLTAHENAGREPEIRAGRRRAVTELFDGLNIPASMPQLAEAEADRHATLATIGARCRSSVVRDGYSREIDIVPGHERSPRLYGQLRKLHTGLTVLGVSSADMWPLVTKVALDGMHPGRRAVLEYLVADSGVHTTGSVAGHCRLTATPTRRHLQDLCAHGVIDLVGEHPERWGASAWLQGSWWAVSGPGI